MKTSLSLSFSICLACGIFTLLGVLYPSSVDATSTPPSLKDSSLKDKSESKLKLEQAPLWSDFVNRQAERFAEEDWYMEEPQKKIPYFEMVTYPLTAVIGGFMFWWPPDEFQSFHIEHEPGDCSEQKTGCADKVGHAFYNYLSVDLLYRHLRHSMTRERALNYALGIDFATSMLIEIGDGYHGFGASLGDVVSNFMGAGFAYFRRVWHLEKKIQARFTYRPSEEQRVREGDEGFLGNRTYDVFQDYNGQITRLQFLPAGFFPSLPEANWILPEIFYNTRGYRPELDSGQRARNIGIGFSFNTSRLVEKLGASHNWLGLFFDYFQLPCTSIGSHHNLDRPQDGWSDLQLQCDALSFSTQF